MTIGNALKFIDTGMEDSALRARLNSAESIAERNAVLSEVRLSFSEHDFDEAYHHRLTQCQELEAADRLREFKLWWDLLARILAPPTCANTCSGC